MLDQERRRTHIRSLDDPQAIQTRSLTASAYRAAVDARVRRVSVQWLCDHAGIARSTFYTHFSSVEDLAAFVITEHFEQLAAQEAENRATGTAARVAVRSSLAHIVRSLAERRDILNYARSESSGPAVVEQLTTWVTEYTHLSLGINPAAPGARSSDLEIEFVSAGLVRMVLEWVHAPGDVTEPEVVDLLLALLPVHMTT